MRRLLFFVLIAALSCQSIEDTPRKMIVIHARGASYPFLEKYLAGNTAAGFLQEANRKGDLKRLIPITNAVTISNIASFETGVHPSDHGVVGHLFAQVDSLVKPVSGFSQRFEVETFWEKADRAGKQVLNVGALTLHGKYETHENVDCLAQGRGLSQSGIFHLVPLNKNSIVTYKVLEENGTENPWQFYRPIADEGTLQVVYNDEQYALDSGGWVEIQLPTEELIQAFRVKWMDSKQDTIRLYVRSAFENRGYPQDFLKEIDQAVGPSKGWPNIPWYADGTITTQALLEEAETEIQYLMDAFAYSVEQKDYDLIYIDYPIMDRYGHAFYGLVEESEKYGEYMQTAYERMSEDFGTIHRFAKANGYELLIASGHGFSGIHTDININRLLGEQGIITLPDPSWEAFGVPGKVSAHIYLNPQLTDERRSEINNTIGRLKDGLRAPGSGELVIESIYSKNELESLGLAHANSGDLYALLKPGYVFQNELSGEGPLFGVPIFKGDHGYSLRHDESYGFIYTTQACDPCRTVDVAPRVLEVLDME